MSELVRSGIQWEIDLSNVRIDEENEEGLVISHYKPKKYEV